MADLGITVHVDRAGSTAIELTPQQQSLKWSSAAVGGFASCSFTVPGNRRADLPYLSVIRVTLGPTVLWEGQVEDADPALAQTGWQTSVTAYGLKRLLEENSVRRIWSKRDIGWQDYPGLAIGPDEIRRDLFDVSTGNYDATDLTKIGVQIQSVPDVPAPYPNKARFGVYFAPSGLTLTRFMATMDADTLDTEMTTVIRDQAGDVAYPADGSAVAISQALSGSTLIALGLRWTAGTAVGVGTRYARFYNIRLLGTTITEDVAGGFYGGTILRDLIRLIPGLTVGTIEDGTDFAIQAIERSLRDLALSVMNEVSGYYSREWGVWENGRFDWVTRSLDEPQLTVNVADCQGLQLDGTLDGIARTVYVLYSDAASGVDSEASASSSSDRNPYVKQGRAKDVLVSPGFPMTALSAGQLASKLATEAGLWVPVQGTVTLPATMLVSSAVGPATPALAIRAGTNILIADLPKTDLFAQGRDGQTLFHIVGAETDLQAGTVQLELEGQSRRSDVLLARLAAATRTVTG